jgi:N-acyl-D-aspartate/D-glutamate deacylase
VEEAAVLDCVVKGGTVVDGTGRPGVQADIGIQDGRVVAVGEVSEGAGRTIDADGLVVAPGFVDIHTHYDAQVKWDPGLAPSVLHGVTTVVGGNTGFTIAPVRDEHADYLRRLLSRVEGMPLSALEQGVEWGTWSSYGEYLDGLEGTLTVNAGFLAGHSAIRRVAMGEQAVGGQPTEDQLQVMERLLDESLAAGALGFSSSNGRAHTDGYGDPVPSRWASEEELLRLCGVVREHEGSVLEYIPSSPPEEADRLTAMSLTADRPLNWNVLTVAAGRIETVRAQMAVSDHAAAQGATVRCLTVPMAVALRYTFTTGFGLEIMPNWGPVFKLPVAERLVALADPAVRDRMRAGAAEARKDPRNAELSDYGSFVVEISPSPENRDAMGRRVDEVAAERGVDSLDALCDIVIADQLQTVLRPRTSGDDDESWALRPDIWRDPRVVLGGSDAGAHLDMMTSFSYFTTMLGESVREREVMSIEEAVHLLVDVPARLYGLKGRGRIAEGWFADLVVLDPDTVATGPVQTRHDLPGGAPRLFADAVGIEHVVVNGVEVVTRGQYTGDRGGTVLRSGRGTETVHADVGVPGR